MKKLNHLGLLYLVLFISIKSNVCCCQQFMNFNSVTLSLDSAVTDTGFVRSLYDFRALNDSCYNVIHIEKYGENVEKYYRDTLTYYKRSDALFVSKKIGGKLNFYFNGKRLFLYKEDSTFPALGQSYSICYFSDSIIIHMSFNANLFDNLIKTLEIGKIDFNLIKPEYALIVEKKNKFVRVRSLRLLNDKLELVSSNFYDSNSYNNLTELFVNIPDNIWPDWGVLVNLSKKQIRIGGFKDSFPKIDLDCTFLENEISDFFTK